MENKEMSPGQWALTLFLAGLPLIGFILLLVWALGDDSNLARKNFAKGSLILYVIILAATILFFIWGGLAMFGLSNY